MDLISDILYNILLGKTSCFSVQTELKKLYLWWEKDPLWQSSHPPDRNVPVTLVEKWNAFKNQ